MTVSAIAYTTHTLASAVADDGTFTVAYPTGHDQASLIETTGGQIVVGENDVWGQGDPGFEFTFGASNITVTNRTGATIAAQSEIKLSFGDRTQDGSYNATIRQPGIVSLTDSSGGTASDTVAAIGASYSQTEVANAVASIIAKQEEIIAALQNAGILRD